MKTVHIASQIADEIKTVVSAVDETECRRLMDHIKSARRVFITAAGRSMLMMRAFAMRLMHMGLCVYVVGDTTTPAIQMGDLLIAGSFSGETPGQIAIARTAKKLGASVCALTGTGDSTLANACDACVLIPVRGTHLDVASIQPTGSLFEQSMFITLESLIVSLSEELSFDLKAKSIYHANLE